jgi:hypothetical protein
VNPAAEDAVIACVDLAGRAGALDIEIGCLDGEPAGRWYARARYQGARITAEGHAGPAEAADALAERLLTGAKCKLCGGLVALSDDGALAYEHPVMADGSTWTAEEARQAGLCRWRRPEKRWVPGCESSGPPAATSVKLADALAAIPGVPAAMVAKARGGFYHDFLSPLATPEVQLLADLRELASRPATPRNSRPLLHALAAAVADGDYGSSPGEAGEWAASPDGQETFRMLLDPGGGP